MICTETSTFPPAGKRLAAGGGSYDENARKWTAGSVKIWDLDAGDTALSVSGHSQPVRSVLFEPGGAWLASAGGYGVGENGELPGEIGFWKPADGAERKRFRLPFGNSSLALSRDGKF